MTIAISISGSDLEASFDSRFGRAKAFCIVNPDTDECQVFENPGFTAAGGAGVAAAQFAADQQVDAVISGAFGPNAYNTLAAAKIKMFLASGENSLSGADVVELYKTGKLVETIEATTKGHH